MKIEVEITERENNVKYCPTTYVCIGKLVVAEYGHNYSGSKGDTKYYATRSPLKTIKQIQWTFETKEEAKNCAYKIAETVIRQLQHKY